MNITRRSFLKYCAASAAALGLTPATLKQLEAALGSDQAPTLLWLHGSGCQGDSISFLNLFADLPPVGPLTAGDVLLDHVNLAYHTVLMSAAGPTAVNIAGRPGNRAATCWCWKAVSRRPSMATPAWSGPMSRGRDVPKGD